MNHKLACDNITNSKAYQCKTSTCDCDLPVTECLICGLKTKSCSNHHFQHINEKGLYFCSECFVERSSIDDLRQYHSYQLSSNKCNLLYLRGKAKPKKHDIYLINNSPNKTCIVFLSLEIITTSLIW